MPHYDRVPSGTTLYVPFTTYGNSDPASITMSGFAVTDIEIYKDGSTTQRASDNGYTLLDTDGTDFDGTTGLHGFSVDLSDNSDSGFYAVGSSYWIVVSTVTVDSKVVTFVAATFRIVAAEATAGYPVVTLKVGTGTGEINLSSGVVPANVTQFGGSNGTFSGGRPEVNTTHWGGTAVASAGLATSANQSTIITHLTDIKGATFDGSTDSNEAIRNRGDAAWITATSVTVSDKTGFSLSGAGVDAIWDEPTAGHTTADTYGDNLRTPLDTATLTAGIADAVWDEALSGHQTAGSAGKAQQDAADSATTITTIDTNLDAAIVTLGQLGDDIADIDTDVTTLLTRTPQLVAYGTTTGTPTTTSIIGTGGNLSTSDDVYNGQFLVITSGALTGVARLISDYVGSTKTFTVSAFPSAPATGVTIAVGGKDESA